MQHKRFFKVNKSAFTATILLFLFLSLFIVSVQLPYAEATTTWIGNVEFTTSSTTLSGTINYTLTQGNMLVAVFTLWNSNAPINVTSITQTGVTWQQIMNVTNNGDQQTLEIYAGIIGAGASTSFSAALSSSASSRVGIVDISEFSGMPSTINVDKTASNTGSSSSFFTSNTGVTSQAVELWVGGFASFDGSHQITGVSSPSGTTLEGGMPHSWAANGLAYYISSASDVANMTATASGSNGYCAAIATFLSTAPHTITASSDSGSTISPSGAVSVSDGNSQSFTFSATGHNVLNQVLVDGSPVSLVSPYTLTNVTTDHTIEVSSTPVSYSVLTINQSGSYYQAMDGASVVIGGSGDADGVLGTNLTGIIQTALNLVSNIVFDSGNFIMPVANYSGGVHVPSNTVISGQGNSSYIEVSSPVNSSWNDIFQLIGVSNVTISNLWLDGGVNSTTSTNEFGIYSYAETSPSWVNCSDVWIHDMVFTNFNSGQNNGIDMCYTDNATIENSLGFNSSYAPIWIDLGTTNFVVRNNAVYGGGIYMVASSYASVANGEVYNNYINGTGIEVYNQGAQPTGISIYNNTIINSTFYPAAIFLYGTTNDTIYNNAIINAGGGGGTGICGIQITDSSTDIVVRNNIVTNGNWWGIQETSGSDYNNIYYNDISGNSLGNLDVAGSHTTNSSNIGVDLTSSVVTYSTSQNGNVISETWNSTYGSPTVGLLVDNSPSPTPTPTPTNSPNSTPPPDSTSNSLITSA